MPDRLPRAPRRPRAALEPRLSRCVAPAAAALLVAGAASAQSTTSVLVDLGTSGFPSNGVAPGAWNDVDPANQSVPFELVDDAGAPTGVQWDILSPFAGANSAGTTSPQPGSPLAEFPPSATRDVMFGTGSTSEIVLSGLGPTVTVDLTFAAARSGVPDMRTTDYLVQGFNGGVATLDPSNNTSETAEVTGILPDAGGTVTIRVRAAASNTNSPTFYYYLGALRIDVTTHASPPLVLGFDQPALDVSRPAGAAPFATPLTVAESQGATPAVTLSAVDDATGLPPTWLALPGAAQAGTPAVATFDPAGLPLGTFTATVTASASGYPDSSLPASLTVRDPDVRNLLFYGNSYSIGNQGMPPLVGFIAEEAGHAGPNVTAKLVGGQDLFFHLTDPDQAAAITGALPLGEEWDAVVMQGFSLEATDVLGDPDAFRANAVAIAASVRAHSPGAKAVMFQTWARGALSSFYPGSYPDPPAMHADIHANYRLAVADIDAAFGAGTAFNGAVGDAVWLLAFDPALYDPDQSHPTPPTTLLAAMVLYQALYRDLVCDLAPDFGGSGNLVTRMAAIGLGQEDWTTLSGIAERVADAELRRLPGSGDDLLLRTGVGGPPTACAIGTAQVGDTIAAVVTSPNGGYALEPAVLFVDIFPTGGPPGTTTLWPEVQFDPFTAIPVSGKAVLGAALGADVPILGLAPGTSVVLQGLSFAGNLAREGAPFTTTDAHEIVLE